MDSAIAEEEPFPEFRKRVQMSLISQEEMEAQGMEPDHMQAKVMPLETLFCKLCLHDMGIRLEFLRGNAGAATVTLRQIKTALRAAMKDIDRDEFVPTFKRGDKFIVPHAANNDNIIGNGDYCHVRMTIDRLNKLKQISLDRTAGVCWK